MPATEIVTMWDGTKVERELEDAAHFAARVFKATGVRLSAMLPVPERATSVPGPIVASRGKTFVYGVHESGPGQVINYVVGNLTEDLWQAALPSGHPQAIHGDAAH